MKLYMDCTVTIKNHKYVIRDQAWNNKIVRVLTEQEYEQVSDFQIIREWCKAKENNPEWLAYKANLRA